MKLINRITVNTFFIVILAVYLVGFFGHALLLGKTVYGDGVYYFSWLHTMLIDHDVNFANEYQRLGGAQPMMPTGLAGNKYSVGPALFWTPAYISVNTVLGGSGYGLPYQLSVGLVGVLSAFFGLVLLFHVLKRYSSTTVSIMSVLTLAGASNLLFYGSVDAVNSHALTFFAAAVFIALLLLPKTKNWFAIGLALGFLGIIRTQDLLYGILLVPYVTKKSFIRLFLGPVIAFTPQLIAWQLLYGKFWVSPYLTGGEGFHFLRPQLLGVLFGVQSGLFLWTPITMLALLEFFFAKTKRIPHKFWMLAVFLLELYAVASWSTWWQGASYSGRMFVSSLPILAFGIASVFSWLATYRWTQAYFLVAIVAPLSALNAVSIIYFLLTLH